MTLEIAKPVPYGRDAADAPRLARSKVRGAAALCIKDMAEGKTVAPEVLAEVSLYDLALIAFSFNAKGADPPSYKDRIQAHQIVQERLLGKPTQKTESETLNRFEFVGPRWWDNDVLDADVDPAA